MDILLRYGLEFDPFTKNAKKTVFESTEYKESLFRLNNLAKTKGFGVLTGSPGRGKTTVVRNWAYALNPSLYKVVYTCFSTLTASDFYRHMVQQLGREAKFKKPDNFKEIREEILRISVETRKTPVIIIDEANYINNSILNDLKIIFNFDMDSRDHAVILLVGLPNLNGVLNQNIHEPLRQRLVMNYNIEGISKEEGRTYIEAKLRAASCRQTVFEPGAVEAILNTSDGSPRIIDKLCSKCLLMGNSKGAQVINADIVMDVINDCELG